MAAGLKYFPAVAGLLLLAGPGGEARERRARLAIGLIALVWVAVDLAPDLAVVGELAPEARGLIAFGAVHLPASFVLGVGETGVFTLVAVIAATVFFRRCRWFEGWSSAPEENRDWWYFVPGAALLTGCFFTRTSYGYCWVFAVWLAPWIWRLARDASVPSAMSKLSVIAATLLLLYPRRAESLVYPELPSIAGRIGVETAGVAVEVFLAAQNPLTWALSLCLLAPLARFGCEGPGGRSRLRSAADPAWDFAISR